MSGRYAAISLEEEIEARTPLSSRRERRRMDNNSAPDGDDQDILYDDFTHETDGTLFSNGGMEDQFDANDTSIPSMDNPTTTNAPPPPTSFGDGQNISITKMKSGVGRFLTIDDSTLDAHNSNMSLGRSLTKTLTLSRIRSGGNIAEEHGHDNGHDEALKARFLAPMSVVSSPKSRRLRIATAGGGGSMHGAPHHYEEMVESVKRLKRMAKFESHDYDQPSSEFEEALRRERPHYDYVRQEAWKWALAALIGITMGIISFLVDWGITALQSAKFQTVKRYMDPDSKSFAAPFFIYLGFIWGFAIVAAALVSYVEPLAAGSGIPELKTYLNGVHLKGLLQLKTLVAKLVGIMFSISSGLIAGKEGPFVHGGGIVGGGIASLGSQTFNFKLPRYLGGYFRNDADHRDFVAIGTAAGVATAFAAPIGGVLFTVEEGASWYTTNILWRGFLATSLGVLTLHYFVELREHPSHWPEAHFGTHRDFGLYGDSTALYGKVFWYYGWEIPIFMSLGVMGGLLGALFIYANVKITKLRQRYIPVKDQHKRFLEVIFVATITAIIFFIATYFSPCQTIPVNIGGTVTEEEASEGSAVDGFLSGADETESGAEDFFPQFWCQPGQYNIFGQLFFLPLSEALRLIYHLGETVPGGYNFPIEVLLTFWAVVYILMTWTYGVGAATGLFVPSLAVGAALGRAYGRLWAVILPNTVINLNSYAIIGSAASLGGATRMTISITVLVMETTGALQLIIPIMLTVFVAKVVGDYFGLGIYDTHIKIRGAPLLAEQNLELEQMIVTDKLMAKDLMAQEIVCMLPQMRIRDVLQILHDHRHGAFPIKSKQGNENEGVVMSGVILRTQILKMLQHRIGWYKMDKSELKYPTTQHGRYHLQSVLENIPFKVPKEVKAFPRHQQITDAEANEMMIDVTYFMNRHPYTISEDFPAVRAYRLFRQIGLRHLFVTRAQPAVVGILTRKDLIEESSQLALGEEAAKQYQAMRPNLPYIPYDAYDRNNQSIRETQ